ncbi:GNAT family N-acetyltransferase [Erythrobacter sp. THAF29]|uniref:GNAT family N-acetyltransferase n=1 Tax=Erythrobacter sp. THAF29 TaxID=2587851 RepID=UPI0012683FB4|nr:GNAT family N-acetyltransferase [Erythrobacter sp. THAF29]QFT76217.1 hypothetical protein FIU90_01550 [Erythrobacter sp. THAF29]
MSDDLDLTITHHVQGQGGIYTAELPGEDAKGTLEWEPREEGVRVATHTIVPPAIGGRGVAARLVDRLVADARRLGFKIMPQCSYVAAKFDENPDWADLRA